jgi:hypothetical protein
MEAAHRSSLPNGTKPQPYLFAMVIEPMHIFGEIAARAVFGLIRK